MRQVRGYEAGSFLPSNAQSGVYSQPFCWDNKDLKKDTLSEKGSTKRYHDPA